jgi:transcriptional regulator with XRE-family HTH domain
MRSYKYLARTIKQIREASGKTQTQFGKEIGVSSQQLSNAERALSGLPMSALRIIVKNYKGSEKLFHAAFGKDRYEDGEKDYELLMKRPSRRSKDFEI